jgi:hypothetical protein
MSKIFKKKDLQEIIKEDMIDYGNEPNRIEPSIERRLGNRRHPLGDNPAFPPTTGNSNFEEIVASENFIAAIDKIKRYAGMKDIQVVNRDGTLNIEALVRLQMQLVQGLANIEYNSKEQLEKLAVRLVMEDFNIPEGVLQFDAKLSNDFDASDIPKQGDQDEEEDEEEIEETMEEIENFDLEVGKRRFINALMHGAAFKGQYMFHMAEEEINAIDDQLIPFYGLLMSITEWAYFMIPPETAAARGGEGETTGGKNRIDMSTEPPTIIARGKTFPLLLHEVVKGVMEFMSMHGLPKNKKMREEVMSKTDFLEAESWDLMLGPGFWQRFLDAIDENELDIKSELYAKIVEMPPQEFNTFMKDIMQKNDRGKQKMVDLANDIKEEITKDEYEKATGDIPDEHDEDDFNPDDVDISDLWK